MRRVWGTLLKSGKQSSDMWTVSIWMCVSSYTNSIINHSYTNSIINHGTSIKMGGRK